MHVWKVARYTCSTPLYIGECDDYVDGGAVSKNPTVSAFGIIREYYQMQSANIAGVVSIGDGLMPGMPLGKLGQSNYYNHFLLSTAVRAWIAWREGGMIGGRGEEWQEGGGAGGRSGRREA